MRIGMMWHDGTKAALADKIQKALSYYSAKYGRVPNMVYLHPTTMVDDCAIAGVQLRTSRGILPNHLWVGVAE